jgi:heat-inducible transcriptional repressor
MPYKRLFGTLQTAADYISETLTKSMYKFKITFRQPRNNPLDFKNDYPFLDQTHCLLLEDKTL